MEARPPFPESQAGLTTEWMTEALGAVWPGVTVAKMETLEQHSGTTGRIRLGLTYASGPAGPDSVFVKLPPFSEDQRRFVASTDMGRREARFYAGPGQEAPLRIPEVYYAAAGDDPTEYIMVLEDLRHSGCTFTTRLEPHAEGHAGKDHRGAGSAPRPLLGGQALRRRMGLVAPRYARVLWGQARGQRSRAVLCRLSSDIR